MTARTATVAWGGRSFGTTAAISVATPLSTNGGENRDVGRGRGREGQRSGDDDEREPHGKPSCRAITIRCTSFVPSPISRIF